MTNSTSHSTNTVLAPAKLTWSLVVTGRRADGYHLLDAEMVTLELCDVLLIEPHETGVFLNGPYGAGIPTDDRNLVHKALSFVNRQARVTVTKNIPHGGGLGGGSANAAAILRWAGCTSPENIRQSAAIGADVPFCVVGGRAQVSGIGEIVQPLDFVDRQVTLVIPPLQVSTPAVYQAWDELHDRHHTGGAEENLANDLEQAAIHVEPALAVWRDRIREACGVQPTLAGSGATWFVTGAHGHMATAVPEAHVIETRTIPG